MVVVAVAVVVAVVVSILSYFLALAPLLDSSTGRTCRPSAVRIAQVSCYSSQTLARTRSGERTCCISVVWIVVLVFTPWAGRATRSSLPQRLGGLLL